MNTNFESKNRNDVRGFTLIELLAVIVILAVVMLIGVNAILPQMETARKNAFAIEANGLIKSAQQYVVTASLTQGIVIDNCNCVTVDTLVDNGQSDLDKSKYSGRVEVTKSGGIYLYKVFLANKSYMVQGKGTDDTAKANVSVENTDVLTRTDEFAGACTTECPVPEIRNK